jgi:hypothetical protein
VGGNDLGALYTGVWRYFVDRELPDCDYCPFDDCCRTRRFWLLETGEINAHPMHDSVPPDYWAVWSRCPRTFDDDWEIDEGYGPLKELMRWSIERGAHRRDYVPARAEYLMREYTRIKDLPKALHSHIAHEKMKKPK